MSRTKKSLKNLLYSGIAQILIAIIGFLVRKYLINILGLQYAGINGLFTNVLSILSLAELGIGTSITYSLYKPLNENNTEMITSLMYFYRSAYRIIGLIITVMGLAIMPFLHLIIKDDISFINQNVIFLLYLLQSVSSYLFFAYKVTLFKADQKDYVLSQIDSIIAIFSSSFQIVCLILFKNFTVYIILLVISNIIKNIYISNKANKAYSFLKVKSDQKLPIEEKRNLYKNCYALFIYKVNGIILNSTDNIILSSFIGLSIVGIYSNYILIVSTIKKILNIFYQSISASVGNLNVTAKKEKKEFIFHTTILISTWLYGVASVGVFVVSNKFIYLWLGEEYTLGALATILMSFNLFTYGFMKTCSIFRTSMGLFQQGKYRPIFGSIINLALSLLLVKKIGIVGVLLGTVISNLLTYLWYDPYIIFKHIFAASVIKYYKKAFILFTQILISALLCYKISSYLTKINFFTLIAEIIICIVVTSLILWVANRKNEEYKYLKKIVLELFSNIIKSRSK